jgi:hypothetical protein
MIRLARPLLIGLGLLGSVTAAAAQPLSADDFRRDLVGMPLCGTPDAGALKGKTMCTVHWPDGTVVVAGSGILARGLWEIEGNRVCRRNAADPASEPHCVDYEKIGPDRYRNSDGVEVCIGPCP